jgi:glycosyltransferase involved in cell wall biosynthesis
VLFVGRLHRDKGIFDLPLIDRALSDRGITAAWSLVGTGSDEADLRSAWNGRNITYLGRRPHAEIPAIAAEHDVFVLPSRYEGFPLALLEAMSVGLVPIATRLDSGIAETIAEGESGFLCAAGDISGFADAIAVLARDGQRLASMGEHARQHIAHHHDLHACTHAYQALFARYAELRRPRPAHVPVPYGTRLDRKWIPNIAVRTVRGIIRRAQGRTM